MLDKVRKPLLVVIFIDATRGYVEVKKRAFFRYVVFEDIVFHAVCQLAAHDVFIKFKRSGGV